MEIPLGKEMPQEGDRIRKEALIKRCGVDKLTVWNASALNAA
jgi:hypothetical protein